MPLNTLRLNHQASTHPNERIVFIKPLPRAPTDQASYDLADTFLRAIAAQCLPIMKKHYLSVTTLEEYEPNPEFIGRNFNNGEVIQLVLRSKYGGWMPFKMVQRVMMHELAHNTHMNHGKGFWVENNKLSNEMRELWAQNYTGEGFWGNGHSLADLQAVAGNNTMPSEELADLQVCGGTFRSRGRKRKRAGGQQDLTWKEKRDRRIEKRFGRNGQALGEDEMSRMMLEVGKKGSVGGKPRVANSKRGRELRAAAALARFGTNKAEPEAHKQEEDDDSDDDYDDVDVKGEDAKDLNGQRLLDSMGFGMLRVCGGKDEDGNGIHVKREIDELFELGNDQGTSTRPQQHTPDVQPASESEQGHGPLRSQPDDTVSHATTSTKHSRNPIYDIPQYRGSPTPPPSPLTTPLAQPKAKPSITIHRLPTSVLREINSSAPTPPAAPAEHKEAPASLLDVGCPICSLSNDRLNPTCMACGHVLDARKDPRSWRCSSEACQRSAYVNAGDCGMCGLCGAGRET